jgi:hypothetical protein
MKIIDKIALQAESEKVQKEFLLELQAFLKSEMSQWDSYIFDAVPPYFSCPRLQLEQFSGRRTFVFFKHICSATVTFNPDTKTIKVTASKEDHDMVKPITLLIASHMERTVSEVTLNIE